MSSHIIEIKRAVQCDAKTTKPTGIMRYRWVCSCGKLGPWKTATRRSGSHAAAARAAEIGGVRHVAKATRKESPC